MAHGETFLMLGGGGLIGRQIALHTARSLGAAKIVIASLQEAEVLEAIAEVKTSNEKVNWVGEWGNLFVRQELANLPIQILLDEPAIRQRLFDDTFGPIDDSYDRSYLVHLIKKHRPQVIVDTINTATALSYQDVDKASQRAKREIEGLLDSLAMGGLKQAPETTKHDEHDRGRQLETLLLSQTMPQLIRHVLLLYRAMREAGTRIYLKIGTTGTGGMGLNIPYTHSEDKPSSQLVAKTAVAFAQTGLLFLMARTPDGPVVKEIKPGAMVGYADVRSRTIPDRKRPGNSVRTYEAHIEELRSEIVLHEPEDTYHTIGELRLPVIDTGENGLFTKGEFETITALGQMQFITPEEIAQQAVLEIQGGNTGYDVIAGIDGSVMRPTYRAGYLRQAALTELMRLEEQTGSHSIALGQLGPPELSKLLWEAELIRMEFTTLCSVLAVPPEEAAQRIYSRLGSDDRLRQSIVSLGLPILSPDGDHVIRGPYIRIPEVIFPEEPLRSTSEDVDRWARRGWVDLRADNLRRWQDRFRKMARTREQLQGRGSSVVTTETYIYEDIRIGEVVAWIFNNEEAAYRIK